jgi:anti-sigma regulatory factor (Ser/Thr protein kinase)
MAKVSYQRSPRRVELKIDSDPANLASTRRAIEAFGGGCGFDKSAIEDVGLCVNEALANVIRHAYGGATDKPIVVGAACDPDSITITIRDWGAGAELPKNLPSKKCDPLTPGGLGLICLKQLMDEVIFAPQPDGGMLLTMTRRRDSVKRRERKRDVG